MSIYVPLLSALGGAIIGSIATVATIWIQSHYQTKRERNRLAIEAAIEDHKVAAELAKTQKRVKIAPLTAYIHYHFQYLKLLENNSLTQQAIEKLAAEQDRLFGVGENE